MTGLEVALVVAALTTAMVAGLLFAFAVVAMPGLARLGDRAYLAAFRAMDRVIQDNQPLFMLVWVGSVVALVAAAVLAVRGGVGGSVRTLAIAALVVDLVGVQAPTVAVNIPLNNRVQALGLATATDSEVTAARAAFEPRWVRTNALRTVFAVMATVLVLLALASA